MAMDETIIDDNVLHEDDKTISINDDNISKILNEKLNSDDIFDLFPSGITVNNDNITTHLFRLFSGFGLLVAGDFYGSFTKISLERDGDDCELTIRFTT